MSELSDKRNLIRKLKEIKENLSYDYQKNYSDIWDTCADFENEYGGIYLCDHIHDFGLLDEDDTQYWLEQNNNDLDRLRYFIGDTYSSDMYRLNAYGNLENIGIEDFKDLCDELIDVVRDDLKSLKLAENVR